MRRATILSLLLLCLGGSSGFTCGPPITVAGFGDSLSAGRDWIAHLPKHWTGLDFGEPGDKCWNDVGARALAAYPRLDADVVVIFCGTNDVRQPNWTLERSMVEIEAAARAAKAQGFAVVLVVPPPIFAGSYDHFNANLFELRYGILELGAEIDAPVADLWRVFWIHADPPTLYKDGVHPNADGRRVMAVVLSLEIFAAHARNLR